jgi:hypothetical protein
MSLLAVCLLVIFIVLNRAFSSWLLCVVFLSIFLAKHTVDVRTIVSLQGTPYDVRTVRIFVRFKKAITYHKVQGPPRLLQGKHLLLSLKRGFIPGPAF